MHHTDAGGQYTSFAFTQSHRRGRRLSWPSKARWPPALTTGAPSARHLDPSARAILGLTLGNSNSSSHAGELENSGRHRVEATRRRPRLINAERFEMIRACRR
ncbi:MAG: hypothetical protein ABSG95_11985 [Solirubrobacteraceae bacterium]